MSYQSRYKCPHCGDLLWYEVNETFSYYYCDNINCEYQDLKVENIDLYLGGDK
jgi:transposase-like protein